MQSPQVFYKKVVLINVRIFAEKHLCWSLFLINLQAWRPATLLKRDPNTGIFLWILPHFQQYHCEEHLRTPASADWRIIILDCIGNRDEIFTLGTPINRLISLNHRKCFTKVKLNFSFAFFPGSYITNKSICNKNKHNNIVRSNKTKSLSKEV